MNPQAEALKARTHDFSLKVIEYRRTVSYSVEADSIMEQLIDSAGSADSNYRATCQSRSRREFVAKIGVAAEEADESLGWLQAARDASLGDQELLPWLIDEANQLTSIFVASHKTAKTRLKAEEERKRATRSCRR